MRLSAEPLTLSSFMEICDGEHVGTDITVHMISGVHGQTKSSLAGSQLLNGKWLAGSCCSFGNAVAVRRRQMTCDSEMRGSRQATILARASTSAHRTPYLPGTYWRTVHVCFIDSERTEHVGLSVGNVLSASCSSFLFSNAAKTRFLFLFTSRYWRQPPVHGRSSAHDLCNSLRSFIFFQPTIIYSHPYSALVDRNIILPL